MRIDLANIETSVPSEGGGLFAESSKLAVTTCTSAGITIRLTLNNNFTPEYYKHVGLTAKSFSDGVSKLPGASIGAASSESYTEKTIKMSVTQDNLESYFEPDSDDMYTLYGFAQAKNGLFYNITAGSPIEFWYSVPSIRFVSSTKTTATIRIKNLEQIYDGTAATMGVTTASFVNGTSSLRNGVDFPAMPDRNNTVILKNLPSGKEITLYFYKHAYDGTYWLLKELTFETQSDEMPECVLEVRFTQKKFDNGVICRDYPVITAENFNQFCSDINAVRKKAGYTAVTFSSVSENDEMTAALWLKVYNAIGEMAILSCSNPSVGNEITPEWFEDLESGLQQIRNDNY